MPRYIVPRTVGVISQEEFQATAKTASETADHKQSAKPFNQKEGGARCPNTS